MRSALPTLAGLILLACAVPAYAQIPLPKAPTAPKSPTAAMSGAASPSPIVLMRTAQEARDNIRALLAIVSETTSARSARATSNPCERAGRGASLSCIDGVKRSLARVGLASADRTLLDQELAILRASLLEAQSAGPARKRTARLAEAQACADRIDGILARLAEPKAAPMAALPLDKLIPGLNFGD
jgi:hypothetical protein